MERPIALKLRTTDAVDCHQVSIDPALVDLLRKVSRKSAPAIIVTRKAAIFAKMSAGMFDIADLVAVSDGDWGKTILVVVPEPEPSGTERLRQITGDAKFLKQVERDAPSLAELAGETIAAIRKAGVDGELVESGGGRWVNRPINTFTLKVQPRVSNLHFTLYGNPESYTHNGFLLQDQNSYSRGWVRGSDDVGHLAALAKLSHARRKR